MAAKKKGKTIDPTFNVMQSIEQAVRRQDDLLHAELRRIDELRQAEMTRVDQQATLRADYSRQLAEAESGRINAIRAVDVAAVAVASERATAQASVLANQVVASAETLRTLVASTATTVAQQLAQMASQLTDRISSLEKSSYEGVGKSRMSDPMMAELLTEMKSLRESHSQSKGSGTGMRDMWGWIVAVVAVLIAGFALFQHK